MPTHAKILSPIFSKMIFPLLAVYFFDAFWRPFYWQRVLTYEVAWCIEKNVTSSVYSRYRVNNLAQKNSFHTLFIFFSIFSFFNENVSFNGISKSLASKCSASGKLPVLLKCRLPGKWFTIENISKLNSEGGWDNLNAAKSVAVAQCKRTRTASSNGGAQCAVTGTLPEIQEADVVKVDYFCWEIGEKIDRYSLAV